MSFGWIIQVVRGRIPDYLLRPQVSCRGKVNRSFLLVRWLIREESPENDVHGRVRRRYTVARDYT